MAHDLQYPNSHTWTQHGRRRVAQRGIDPAALAIVMKHGVDYPAGSGCSKRTLHRADAIELSHEIADYALLEKAGRIVAIIGRADELVTSYYCNPHETSRARRSSKSNRRRARNHGRAG